MNNNRFFKKFLLYSTCLICILAGISIDRIFINKQIFETLHGSFKQPDQFQTDAQKQFQRHVGVSHIPRDSVSYRQFNFHVVTPGIWRSSHPNFDSLAKMKEHGLKTVINLQHEEDIDQWEQQATNLLGLSYYNFPMRGNERQDDAKLSEILDIIHNPHNQPVLVHCYGGRDRTGMITALYKIKYTEESVDDVYKEMLMYGFTEHNHKAIIDTIYDWAKTENKDVNIRNIRKN